MNTQQNAVIERTKEILEKAGKIFNLHFNIEDVEIKFDLRGKAAGQAEYYTRRFGFVEDIIIRYNVEAIEKDFEHIINQTVPHEIAHLIAYNERSYSGSKIYHGRKWKQAVVALGGSADRCHNISLTSARKTRQWIYVLPNGEEITLKTNRHNKILRGAIYSLRTKFGNRVRISSENFVKQVEETLC